MATTILCQTEKHAAIALNGHGYLVVNLVEVDGKPIYDDKEAPIFRSWEALVALFTEIAMSDGTKGTRERILPQRLSNLRLWTVSLGRPLSRDHESAWDKLCEEFIPMQDKEATFEWEEPTVGAHVLTRDPKKGFSFSGPLYWSSEELIKMMCFVLSDGKTADDCGEQYSPFLAVLCQGAKCTVKMAEASQTPTPSTGDPTPITTILPAAPPTQEATVFDRAQARFAAFVTQKLGS